VPGILNPVVLMQKSKDGSIVPYNYGNKWKDGSLRTDIPVQPLHMHFNVKNTIVSQVNPHIHLFFYAPRGSVGRPVTHRRGKGWRGGFLVASIEQFLKLDLSKWLKWVRDLELLPRFADQDWSSIWLQKFEGNITIWPHSSFLDFFYILKDPTRERLVSMITSGQRVTWPKLHMISNRLRIERAIQKGREELRRELRRQRHLGIDNHFRRNNIDELQDDDTSNGIKSNDNDKYLEIEKVTDIGPNSDYGSSLESSSDDDYDDDDDDEGRDYSHELFLSSNDPHIVN
jgi:hypothetical protein